MTTKIGLAGAEATVSDPFMSTYSFEKAMVQSSQRVMDATLHRQIVTFKRTWHVEWRAVNTTMESAIYTELDRQSNLSWLPPTGSTYTVQCNGYKRTYVKGTARINIVCDLVEV